MANAIPDSLKQYIIYGMPVLSLAILLIVLHTASPLDVGPAGILVIFILIYVLMVSLLYAALHTTFVILTHFHKSILGPKRKLLYYLASIVGLGPVFLLALHSIGQLELKDFILVTLLVAVACFYVIRRYK